MRLHRVNFRMAQSNMDYNNMDYNNMDSPYVCDLCDMSFSRDYARKRHMESKHGLDTKEGHTCADCGKSFNRNDNLRRHQLTCQAIRFKCPLCHRMLKDIASLTRHMGLCPIPTCGTCQEQFAYLDQMREHKKTTGNEKPLPTPSLTSSKSENVTGGSIVVSV